jgi:hypothetical protein
MIDPLRFRHLMSTAARRGKLHACYDVRDPMAVVAIVVDLNLCGDIDPIALDECARAYHTRNAGGRWRRYVTAMADPVNVFDF